jgi:PAS domain S-box-containing protein
MSLITTDKIKRNSDYLSYILSVSTELFIFISSEKIITEISLLVEKYFSCKKSDLIGQSFESIFSNKNIVVPFSEEEFNSLVNAEKLNIETIITFKRRNPVYILWSIVTIKDADSSGFFIIGHDITIKKHFDRQQQSAQNQLERISSCVPGNFYWKSMDGKYLGCNQTLLRTLGLNSIEELVGKTDRDLWPEQEQTLKENDNYVITNRETIFIEETVSVPGKNDMYFTVIKMPLLNDEGAVIGILGNSLDITELKNTEAALKVAKEAAETANNAKTEFIANMSHDIRTPLTGVVGMSKLLEDNVIDPKLKQYARWLGESGDQLLKMLNGILDVVSADNASEEDIYEEAIDIRRTIQDILQLERPSILIKGIDLMTHVDETIPVCIITDSTKLHRILLNLLGNAIKFTEKGHVKLTIQHLATHDDTATLRFEVSDTGIGIPQNLLDKVFDRFFRVTPSYNGTYTGHGVGLHIAQSYAHLLGSEIKLISKPNIGTTFSFDLSLQIGDEHQLMKTKSLSHTVNRSKTCESTENVPHLLLVEDNSIALLMLENLVTKAGCHFTTATNGETALSLAKAHRFDLIITDLGLPVLSGLEFTTQLRAFEAASNRPAVPIIGLTAHAEEKIKQNCKQIGMNEALTKPMTLDILNAITSTYFTPKASNYLNAVPPKKSEKIMLSGTDAPDTIAKLFDLDSFALLSSNNAITAMSGNRHLFKTILLCVVNEHMPKDKATLKSHHVNGNWEAIEEAAHYLKSGALYYGADRLVHACQYLEQYRKAGHSALLEPLYQQLIRLMDETSDAIRHWLAS